MTTNLRESQTTLTEEAFGAAAGESSIEDRQRFETQTYFLDKTKIEPALHQVTLEDGTKATLSARQISALALLASHTGQFVPTCELHQVLHDRPQGTVVPSAFAKQMSRIRKALGDDAQTQRMIRTIRGTRSRDHHAAKGSGYSLRVKPTFEPCPVWQAAPYRGLQSYDEQHEPIFFGRAKEKSEILEHVQRASENGFAFVLVTGASGTGKSSIVKAAVLPALTRLKRHDGFTAHSVCLTCGRENIDSLRSLAKAVVTVSPLQGAGPTALDLPNRLREVPERADQSILEALLDSHRAEHYGSDAAQQTHLTVMVDQLEQLFLLDESTEPDGKILLVILRRLAECGWCTVIGTLRSDTLALALEHPEFAVLCSRGGFYTLQGPTRNELQAIICRPAALAGVKFEEHEEFGPLHEQMVVETLDEVGALPVLSFAMDQLYDKRDDRGLITWEAYRELGGIKGCIARHAEKTLSTLPVASQNMLGVVLTQLVSIRASGFGENAILQRPASLRSLTPNEPCTALVDALVDNRLLSISSVEEDSPAVQVSHEAVLTHWDRARKWISDNTALISIHERVATGAREWRDKGTPDSLLLQPGIPLDEARALGKADIELGFDEQRFLAASLAGEENVRRRRRMVRHVTIAGVALISLTGVIAAALGLLAVNHSRRADLAAESARAQAAVARRTTDAMVHMFRLAGPDYADGRDVTARDMLGRYGKRFGNDDTIDPAVRASLLDAIGRAYTGLADYDDALEALTQALALRGSMEEKDQVALADTTHFLGWAYFESGDMAQGKELMLRAQSEYEQLGESLRLASISNNLGVLYREAGDYTAAEESYRKAISVKEALYGALHADVATLKANLGQLLNQQGRFDEAEPLLLSALRAQEALYPKQSPKLAYSYNGLAKLYQNLGRHDDARLWFERALDIREASLDIDHPLIALSLNNLGSFYLTQGDSLRAADLLARAVRIGETSLPSTHRYLAIYRTNLADAFLSLGRFDESANEAARAMRGFDAQQGVESWRIWITRSVLVAAQGAGDCDDQSLQALQTAYEELKGLLGENDTRTQGARIRMQQACGASVNN